MTTPNINKVPFIYLFYNIYFLFIYWRRKWQPTPVFMHEKSHGWRSLLGYTPWGHKESDTTEPLTHTVPYLLGCSMWALPSSLQLCLTFKLQAVDLVPWPGIKPKPPAFRAWNLGHWITREIPVSLNKIEWKVTF